MAESACVALPADILLPGQGQRPALRLLVREVCQGHGGVRGQGRDVGSGEFARSVAGPTLLELIQHAGCGDRGDQSNVVSRVGWVADRMRAMAERVRGGDREQLLAGLACSRVAPRGRDDHQSRDGRLRGVRGVGGTPSLHAQTVLSPLLALVVLLSLTRDEEQEAVGSADVSFVAFYLSIAIVKLTGACVEHHQTHARDVERRALARAVARMDLTLAERVREGSLDGRTRLETDVAAALSGFYPADTVVDVSTQHGLMWCMWNASTERTGGA
jgi:hypothetical protein